MKFNVPEHLKHATGVYKIECIPTGEIYIGRTMQGFRKRFLGHITDYKRSKSSEKLTAIFCENFDYCAFEILEIIPNDKPKDYFDYIENVHIKHFIRIGYDVVNIMKMNIVSLRSPNGDFVEVFDLKKFLKENNIGNGLYKLISGEFKKFNGWTLWENQNYSRDLRNHKAKVVYCFNTSDVLLKKYNAISDTELDGFTPSCVSACCRGKCKTHKGYKWSYSPVLI